MTTTPRRIIYMAVCNYITEENSLELLNELCKFKKITDGIFMRTVAEYFDITRFRDAPYIKEDIWLFNYLMFETR